VKSYNTSPSWTEYRGILDTRFGIRIDRPPRETWRKIRGHDFHVDVWEPEGPARGTLILVHGGGGNGRVLAPFADLAAGLGWRALAPDLPGYGLLCKCLEDGALFFRDLRPPLGGHAGRLGLCREPCMAFSL
jgi:pimeloyl-ACP methyl ester carboxylesterase